MTPFFLTAYLKVSFTQSSCKKDVKMTIFVSGRSLHGVDRAIVMKNMKDVHYLCVLDILCKCSSVCVHLLRWKHVCLEALSLSGDRLSVVVSWRCCGPPTAFPRTAPHVPWVSLPGNMLELYSSRISVDQDLSVIVAKIDNDDDVKQRLVPIVFHASVTQQRSSGSKTRISCSHVHERTNSCPPLQTRVREKGSHTN